MKEFRFPGHLAQIPRGECLELLADRAVGRVAYCDLHGPMVLPVNYALQDWSVWLLISPYSEMARHLRHAGTEAAVAFEVDEFDTYTEAGRSVLVHETAAALPEQSDRPDPEGGPRPWAQGSRELYIRIRPASITGRWLLSA